jgi:hypothetical protein
MTMGGNLHGIAKQGNEPIVKTEDKTSRQSSLKITNWLYR